MRVQCPACGIENRAIGTLRPAAKNIVTEKPPINSTTRQRPLFINLAIHECFIVEVSRYNPRGLSISDLIKNARMCLDKRCSGDGFTPQRSRWAVDSHLPEPQIAIFIRQRAASQPAHPRRRSLGRVLRSHLQIRLRRWIL